MVAAAGAAAYLGTMSEPSAYQAPAFLDADRPPVPDLVVPGVVPFHLPNRPVRGRLVRLGPLAEALLSRHDNTDAVTRLAGEALALVAALATALKFRGSFSLQAKGKGPVSMLVADCTEAGALRFYARADAERLATLGPKASAAALLGQGYLAFTVDQGPETERHQGIVAIDGHTLSDMALHYFATSEQLRSTIRLACARTPQGWRASALILERIAGAGGIAPDLDAPKPDELTLDDAWTTATTLAATVSDAELLDDTLPPEQLLFRLFHTEGVAADLPRALAYGCRCSRQRLAGLLETFPPDDLDHMATAEGSIVMTCEFCNVDFRFDRAGIRNH